jgi:uncharacterized membrane protein
MNMTVIAGVDSSEASKAALRQSATLIILRTATCNKCVEAPRPYGGTILRTSLSHEAAQQLMKILHGRT